MDVSADSAARRAVLYRKVTEDHLCPFGLKARALLKRRGFEVDDRKLTTPEEEEAVKRRFDVRTTPQIVIGGERVGGYDDLRQRFGLKVKDEDATSYAPVIAVFGTAALMALAAAYATGGVFAIRSLEWFVAFSMCLLALMKLRNVESFSNSFLSYDLLARRWVPYSYIYPFAELAAGILMIAGALIFVAAPIALFIGAVGAVSVFKAVYIDRRELKCACVGGDSNTPLGFVSLTENLMMIAMAVWMLAR